MIQKFKRGDVVHIADDLGPSMSHFPKDKDVVIMYSYAEGYGGFDMKSYSVLDFDGCETSWYYEQQLTLLRHIGEDGIAKIKKEREEREKIESDLGWIVDNWKKVRTERIGASLTKLMFLIGITKPWGENGEYIDLSKHISYTIKCLDSVLLSGDIEIVEYFITNFPKINEFIFSSDFHNGNHEFRKPVYEYGMSPIDKSQ